MVAREANFRKRYKGWIESWYLSSAGRDVLDVGMLGGENRRWREVVEDYLMS